MTEDIIEQKELCPLCGNIQTLEEEAAEKEAEKNDKRPKKKNKFLVKITYDDGNKGRSIILCPSCHYIKERNW